MVSSAGFWVLIISAALISLFGWRVAAQQVSDATTQRAAAEEQRKELARLHAALEQMGRNITGLLPSGTEDAIAAALEADDPGLVRIDACELRAILEAAAEDRQTMLQQMNAVLEGFEARIATIEEKMRSR